VQNEIFIISIESNHEFVLAHTTTTDPTNITFSKTLIKFKIKFLKFKILIYSKDNVIETLRNYIHTQKTMLTRQRTPKKTTVADKNQKKLHNFDISRHPE